ncbi:hypothetical protein [Wenzhouxiangella limi]|uniref:Uncharacterized protein n=1 Tax=Wenzhouxiangella limi TaxID=2707351 RepID=A0A845V9A6_9GAMM|nr:hypothetical protein [Wenzhouxiangella limi]NDY96731.1 hypothetical protein [Wenzhouxiangella limi]
MAERRFVIEVDGLPEPADRPELLELILAAASLEMAFSVLLRGNAAELLTLPSTRAWRQLIDQGLADVGVPGPTDGAALPAGVAIWNEHQLAKLVGEATVIRA